MTEEDFSYIIRSQFVWEVKEEGEKNVKFHCCSRRSTMDVIYVGKFPIGLSYIEKEEISFSFNLICDMKILFERTILNFAKDKFA